MALQWRDIDLLLATLAIRRKMYVLRGGRLVYEEPKNDRGRRQIAMPPTLSLALADHRKRMEQILGVRSDNDLVFTWEDGRPMRPATVSHAFTRIVRRGGLEGFRLHDLRHSHASLMLKEGVHPQVVSERLGHASISITLDTYSHVLPGIQRAAAEAFDKSLADTLPEAQRTTTEDVPLTNG